MRHRLQLAGQDDDAIGSQLTFAKQDLTPRNFGFGSERTKLRQLRLIEGRERAREFRRIGFAAAHSLQGDRDRVRRAAYV
jgi:hypothetical protein